MALRDEIKYYDITKKWGSTEFCREIDNEIDAWLEQFKENEKQLMLQFLKYFYHYTEEYTNRNLVLLHNMFKDKHPEEYSRALFSGIEKDFHYGFSNCVISFFMLRNKIKHKMCKDLAEFVYNIDDVPEVFVFVDDYSGSGKSFIDFVDLLIKKNKKVTQSKLYFLVIHISNKALGNISKYAVENNLQIECVYIDKSEGAFCKGYIFNDELEINNNKKLYSLTCDDHNINKKWRLGFKETEALIAFDYNTPNNTLGIFWESNDSYKALFERFNKSDITLTSMQNKAKQNKNLRQHKILIQNIEETKLNNFMVYCVAWKKNFLLTRACKDFGQTPDQLMYIIVGLTLDGYIKLENDKIIPTPKMENYIFSSRFVDYKKIYYDLEQKKILPEFDFEQDKYVPTNFNNDRR